MLERSRNHDPHPRRIRLPSPAARAPRRERADRPLLHCEKKDKSGWYWKVKLDSGEWVWPADLHVDGQGALVQHCRECRLPFLGDGVKDFCYRCNEELFGVVPPVTERADYQGTRPRGPARR
jgi:hypothetical protein